ncbi:MAG: TetR/AcrR family transcriptional regulator [Kineosporiaceae bacterium]
MNVAQAASRRDRVRASTVDEIKRTARALLRGQGPAAMSLRAIAREMGMTAPALYRYFPSHEDLASALVCDLYEELADVMAAVRDTLPADQPQVRLIAIAFTFRDWSVANPHEFGLVFGTPLPALVTMGADHDDRPEHLAGMRFGMVFTVAFLDLWNAAPFGVRPDDELPEGLRDQLTGYRASLDVILPGAGRLPLGAIHTFLECWVQLYGLVAMEVFDHLHFCLADVGPFFQVTLGSIAGRLGMDMERLHAVKAEYGLGELAGLRERIGVRLTPEGL